MLKIESPHMGKLTVSTSAGTFEFDKNEGVCTKNGEEITFPELKTEIRRIIGYIYTMVFKDST